MEANIKCNIEHGEFLISEYKVQCCVRDKHDVSLSAQANAEMLDGTDSK